MIIWCDSAELPEHLRSYAEDTGNGLCIMLFDDGIVDTVNVLLTWLRGRNIDMLIPECLANESSY